MDVRPAVSLHPLLISGFIILDDPPFNGVFDPAAEQLHNGAAHRIVPLIEVQRTDQGFHRNAGIYGTGIGKIDYRAGDSIRFSPITPEEFETIARQVEEGSYRLEKEVLR